MPSLAALPQERASHEHNRRAKGCLRCTKRSRRIVAENNKSADCAESGGEESVSPAADATLNPHLPGEGKYRLGASLLASMVAIRMPYETLPQAPTLNGTCFSSRPLLLAVGSSSSFLPAAG